MHRDIKPENILIDGKHENIKLVEFNASKKFDPGTKISEPYGTLYYIAPEVLMVDYDEKCDIWSIGVIMFVLLSGTMPFEGENEEKIKKKIIVGDYKMEGSVWEGVSEEAKDLIRKMLTYDPSQRISAVTALEHEWFKKYIEYKDATMAVIKALTNLKSFKAEQKLQQAAITFIVSQLATSDDMNEIQIAFKDLDKNMDAKLSLDEIKEGYK
jgi:calcium-dependent protein kinase